MLYGKEDADTVSVALPYGGVDYTICFSGVNQEAALLFTPFCPEHII